MKSLRATSLFSIVLIRFVIILLTLPESQLLALPGFQGIANLDSAEVAESPSSEIRLSLLGRYESGIYKKSGAEIVAYDPDSKRAFVINAFSGKVDVLDLRAPSQPALLFSIDVSDLGADANSVAVKNGIVAVAVQAAKKTDNGFVAFYTPSGQRKSVVQAGALPDAVTFSPDGRYLLVANEGEPNDDYTFDPEGSITIVDVSGGIESINANCVKSADFRHFNDQAAALRAKGIRIFGPGATVAQDLEPEWIEVSRNSKTAYVCLQENNAIAVVDIASASVNQILPLGYKDWSANGKWSGNGFDSSDRDGGIHILHWPVFGMFQPDTIRLLEVGGETYLIGANEGDSRDWSGWSEEARVADLRLDPQAFPNAASLQKKDQLGRLLVTTTMGVMEGHGGNPSELTSNPKNDCVYNALYAFGGRSMGIWRVTEESLELIFDTGSQLEETIAETYPNYFNADHEDRDVQLDRRSASKGPEPEGLALGEINGRTYAFLGLERIGGIMVYDVTEPKSCRLIQYINTRDFSIAEDSTADHTKSDLGPEGLCFIPASQSPDSLGRPLLLVGNEVSGTTAIYVID